ncbi:MAG: adenylyl-sulfate kinase [Salegentibacter sp.]|uniref:Adenylyl-sulfate kinase n=1 Tax=Salegentibacter flavus TaxID=287099 RepID=A0A1I5A7U4_9FLAO|nr:MULTISPECIES: adenylyl-sulfate kinase [Salegentibacter]MDR9458475.1 adenylyl-sulfate kinase [Salegentibacter sp.]SFN58219.1 adenylylsulfate kinase [Salegentibacter flavus]
MENIIPHEFHISKTERNKQNGHTSFVVWFTGLSGSGKSTIANQVEHELYEQGIKTFSLDGDNIRKGLNNNLGFTAEDRQENLRRIAEVAKLFVESGAVVIASFISPLKKDRELIKEIIGEEDFIEVFVNTSLEECERRDVKGLYKKARAGEIKNFTGIDAPYENPENPDLEIKTESENLEEAIKRIVLHLQDKLKISVQ